MSNNLSQERIELVRETLNKTQSVNKTAELLKMTKANVYRIISLYLEIEEEKKTYKLKNATQR
jgi:DNA invertase Pin-like site-specific DNA recombinase